MRYLIPGEKSVDSLILTDYLDIYGRLLDFCKYESILDIQVHFEIIPEIVQKIKKHENPENCDTLLLATSKFILALFSSLGSENFDSTVFDPNNLPLLSAVVFHSIYLFKNSNSGDVILTNLEFFQKLFQEENLKDEKSRILSVIFPGNF